jgi:hypothetical protein
MPRQAFVQPASNGAAGGADGDADVVVTVDRVEAFGVTCDDGDPHESKRSPEIGLDKLMLRFSITPLMLI